MSFKKGDTTHAVRNGGLVQLDDSGNLVDLNNDSSDRPIGVCRQNVAMTDTSSWLLAPMVQVEVPVETVVEWLVDVDSDAGLVDSDVGRYCSIDTAGGNSVAAGDSCSTRIDRSDTGVRQFFITGVLSTTKARGVIVNTAWGKNLGDSAMG